MIAVFGLVLGPIAWGKSAYTQREFNDFKSNGEKTTAIIDSKDNRRNFRVSIITVDLHYRNKSTQKMVYAKHIDVNAYYFDKLKLGATVAIYYKGDDVILVDNYNWENLPPIKKPYWGMIYTLFSYAYITYAIINTRRKRKKNNA